MSVIASHRGFASLFNSFSPTIDKTPKLRITGFRKGNPLGAIGIPSQRDSIAAIIKPTQTAPVVATRRVDSTFPRGRQIGHNQGSHGAAERWDTSDLHTSRQSPARCTVEGRTIEQGHDVNMMTLSDGNMVHVTGHLWGESTGQRRIPPIKSSDAELWCVLWSTSEQTAQQITETATNWDAIALIMTSL